MMKCVSVCRSGTCSLHQLALSPLSEREQRFIILFFINHYTCSIKVMMMEDCQDYDDQLKSANIYCFRVELSAEGAKRGVETPPKVFPPDDLPRPSRPKAGLGLVMMMKMVMMMLMMMVIKDLDTTTVKPMPTPRTTVGKSSAE